LSENKIFVRKEWLYTKEELLYRKITIAQTEHTQGEQENIYIEGSANTRATWT
jgi:hypothetical protein